MGLVVESRSLAAGLSRMLDEASPSLAYEVTLQSDGSLRWHDGLGTRLEEEPETSWFRCLGVHIFSLLPIEWLL